jgi:putative copper export protein
MMKLQDLLSSEGLFWAFTSFLGVFLMLLTYTYVDKLEKVKCDCAEHPYRKFIKNYILFAVVFLAVTAFLPPSKVHGALGPLYAVLYGLVHLVYAIATFVFFIYAVKYVNYLAKEKCKCSEDVRRTVLYWWSILMIIVLVATVILPFLLTFVFGGVGLVMSSGKSGLKSLDRTAMEASVNPLKAAKKVPGSLRSSLKRVSRMGK